MKLPDPDIQTGPWEEVRGGVQRNLDKLASAMPGTGGQAFEIRCGVVTLTWPGTTDPPGVLVAHGLGRVPVAVFATAQSAPSYSQIPTAAIYQIDTSLIGVTATTKATYTGDIDIAWLAIG